MCEVLEKFAGEIPANYRTQIETACVDFVAMNEKMGISPFCVLNFRGYIDSIIKHNLYDFAEEERNKLCDMGLLDYRYLFEQMVSVYRLVPYISALKGGDVRHKWLIRFKTD